MSFFPRPDPQRLRDSFIQQNVSPYYQTPVTPPASANPQSLNKNTLPFDGYDHAYETTSHSTTWPGEPHGLGLVTFTQAMSSADGPLMTPAMCTSVPFTWPNEFESSTSSTSTSVDHLASLRSPTWDACDTFAVPTSALTTWPSHLATSAEYPYSPARSMHSASTYASNMPSPYAHSDRPLSMDHSRTIKIEEQSSYSAHQSQYLLEAPQSMQVRPGDLMAGTSKAEYQTYNATDMATTPDLEEDIKPVLPRRRTSRRRDQLPEGLTTSHLDRPKRGFTKPETANCACDQCGKLFQRSYNLKAHLDTHAPNRDHPYVCMYGDCDKRFVRRTDLLRHEQSVHLKERNFTCPLCDSAFARKDTLRRHIDDGCPRRPEVKKRTIVKARRSSSAHTPRDSRPPSAQREHVVSPTRSPLSYPARHT